MTTLHELVAEAKRVYELMEYNRTGTYGSSTVSLLTLGKVQLLSNKTSRFDPILLAENDAEIVVALDALMKDEEYLKSTSLKNIVSILDQCVRASLGLSATAAEEAIEKLTPEYDEQFSSVPNNAKFLLMTSRFLNARLQTEKAEAVAATRIEEKNLRQQEVALLKSQFELDKKLQQNYLNQLADENSRNKQLIESSSNAIAATKAMLLCETTELAATSTQLENVREEYDELEIAFTRSQEELKAAQQEIERKQVEVAKAQAPLGMTREELRVAREDLRLAKSELLNKTRKIELLLHFRAADQTTLNELNVHIEKILAELKQKEAEIDLLTNKLLKQSQESEKQSARLKDEINHLIDKLALVAEETDELETQNTDQASFLEMQEKILAEKYKAFEARDTELKAQQTQKEELENRLHSMEGTLIEVQKHNKQLQARLNEQGRLFKSSSYHNNKKGKQKAQGNSNQQTTPTNNRH